MNDPETDLRELAAQSDAAPEEFAPPAESEPPQAAPKPAEAAEPPAPPAAAKPADARQTAPEPAPNPRPPSPPSSRHGADEPMRDPHGYTASDYEAAAKQFETAGDANLARSARMAASDLRHRESQRHVEHFSRAVQHGIQETIEKRPEFADPASASGKAVLAVLDEHPLLRQIPGGFAAAVAIHDGRKSAGSLADLQGKIDTLTRENDRLTRLTSLPSSNPASAPRDRKDFSEKDLRRLAAECDEN